MSLHLANGTILQTKTPGAPTKQKASSRLWRFSDRTDIEIIPIIPSGTLTLTLTQLDLPTLDEEEDQEAADAKRAMKKEQLDSVLKQIYDQEKPKKQMHEIEAKYLCNNNEWQQEIVLQFGDSGLEYLVDKLEDYAMEFNSSGFYVSVISHNNNNESESEEDDTKPLSVPKQHNRRLIKGDRMPPPTKASRCAFRGSLAVARASIEALPVINEKVTLAERKLMKEHRHKKAGQNYMHFTKDKTRYMNDRMPPSTEDSSCAFRDSLAAVRNSVEALPVINEKVTLAERKLMQEHRKKAGQNYMHFTKDRARYMNTFNCNAIKDVVAADSMLLSRRELSADSKDKIAHSSVPSLYYHDPAHLAVLGLFCPHHDREVQCKELLQETGKKGIRLVELCFDRYGNTFQCDICASVNTTTRTLSDIKEEYEAMAQEK